MNIKKHSVYLALSILMFGAFAAQAQTAPGPTGLSAQSPRPIPETGGGDCWQVGSGLWECCEENEDEMQTICSIEVDNDVNEWDLYRPKQPMRPLGNN